MYYCTQYGKDLPGKPLCVSDLDFDNEYDGPSDSFLVISLENNKNQVTENLVVCTSFYDIHFLVKNQPNQNRI